MLSFISILYYKNLSDHVTMFVKTKSNDNNNKISEYFGDLGGPNNNKKYEIESKKFGRRIYNKKIVNKWILMVFLIKNPILITQRKDYLLDFKNSLLKQSLIEKCFSYDFSNGYRR